MSSVGKVANGSEDTQREPTVENNDAGCSKDNKFKSPGETKPASLACDASDARVGDPVDLAVGGGTGGADGLISDKGNIPRKLLTTHRTLIVDLNTLSKQFERCNSQEKFEELSSKFDDLKMAYNKYHANLQQLSEFSTLDQLTDRIVEVYKNCYFTYDECYMRLNKRFHDEVEASDSASQTAESTSTSSELARRIDLDQKLAELKVAAELAEAREAKMLAEAEARAEKAETLAKLRLEEARVEAEQKLISCSERGSSVAASRRSRASRKSLRDLTGSVTRASKAKLGLDNGFSEASKKPTKLRVASVSATRSQTIKTSLTQCEIPTEYSRFDRTRSWVHDVTKRTVQTANTIPKMPIETNLRIPGPSPVDHTASAVHKYLERQGRNEYINLASQIAYNGNNLAFVFFENQIRKLMVESPHEERRLEVLRASCVGQPREMVNLFFAPFKSMSTSERIERALDRLRQRYGVSGFLSEPKVQEIRNSAKVTHTVSSLKSSNEDLNTLEVFAYAHDKVDKLSEQLLLDVANRLPGTLKRRYIDYLDRRSNLDQPGFEGFEALRNFVVHEINVMTSDYAQALFKTNEDKVKSRDSGGERNTVRVRHTAFSTAPDSAKTLNGDLLGANNRAASRNQRSPAKSPPECFLCAEKHYLADCAKFKALSNHLKRQTVIDSGRCLNCLSLGNPVRNCAHQSKCRKCRPDSKTKHATALHDCYATPRNVGAAGKTPTVSESSSNSESDSNTISAVRKVNDPDQRVVLLRTAAVRVINPDTKKSSLAYAQLDTASQATIISVNLCTELGLKRNVDSVKSIRTFGEGTMSCKGLTNFNLESLSSGENFAIKDALVVPEFVDNEDTLPHRVDTSDLMHFNGVEIPTLPHRKNIDILVGQSDKALLTVLEERESLNFDEPNLVLTRLGPVASGGPMDACSASVQNRRVEVVSRHCDAHNWDELKLENATLKENLRQLELQEEELQPSKNDEIAQALVESNIKVVEDRYEIPVPLKQDVVETLPNNYDYALKRTKMLRTSGLKNLGLKDTLTNTFAELINEGWIEDVGQVGSDHPVWYLPFFVTKQDKPRVVYDGAATVAGVSLNQAVLAGTNLLNNLVEVLTRFRLGKFAAMADLSKCFFQVAMPEKQRDLFRIIWFKNNDLDGGEPQVFRFSRHVWGMNSSPYVALLAIKHLITENPTNASDRTLNAIDKNRYMDDILFTSDSLLDLETMSRESTELFKSRGFKLRFGSLILMLNQFFQRFLNLISRPI